MLVWGLFSRYFLKAVVNEFPESVFGLDQFLYLFFYIADSKIKLHKNP